MDRRRSIRDSYEQTLIDMIRCSSIWWHVVRYEIITDVDRYGEIWTDVDRYEIWTVVDRYEQMLIWWEMNRCQ